MEFSHFFKQKQVEQQVGTPLKIYLSAEFPSKLGENRKILQKYYKKTHCKNKQKLIMM